MAPLLVWWQTRQIQPERSHTTQFSNSTPTTSQVEKVDPVPASSLNAIQYSNQQPNLSHLSGCCS
jgi:hypothetical protein